MFEENINPDLALAGSEGNAIEEISLLFVKVIGDEGAIEAFCAGEVELIGDVF
jgi:hypothetical protein